MFLYFGPSAPGITRPPKPTASPLASKIGNRIRPLNASVCRSLRLRYPSPVSRITSSGSLRARTSACHSSGAQPMRNARTSSPLRPRSRRYLRAHGRVGSGQQPLVVPVDGLLHRLHEAGAPLAGLALALVRVAQRDARPSGEELDGADEVEVLHLPDEGDDVAAHLTAPAAVQAELLVHVEARRLLRVERTEPDPPLARAAELGVLRDHADDVGGLPYGHDVVVDDAHCARR